MSDNDDNNHYNKNYNIINNDSLNVDDISSDLNEWSC